MAYVLVAVIGEGDDSTGPLEEARLLGQLVAEQGWVLVNGGRNVGVMDASARGARERKGITVGLLPGSDASNASSYCDIPIPTGLNNARNNLVTLSARIVFAFPGGAGTLSEVALALKNKKDVILVGHRLGAEFERCGKGQLHFAAEAKAAIEVAKELLKKPRSFP